MIYLTFDDGVDVVYTPKLLDLLLKYDIPATFFIVAATAKEHPELVERIYQEGHGIGIHNLTHRSGYLMTPGQTRRAVKESLEIFDQLHIRPKFYRPPWGHVNLSLPKVLKENSLKMVLWDVMAEDWEGDTTAGAIAYKLLTRTHQGDIICLHDGRGSNEAPARTIEALAEVLPRWQRLGYQFGTMEDYDE